MWFFLFRVLRTSAWDCERCGAPLNRISVHQLHFFSDKEQNCRVDHFGKSNLFVCLVFFSEIHSIGCFTRQPTVVVTKSSKFGGFVNAARPSPVLLAEVQPVLSCPCSDRMTLFWCRPPPGCCDKLAWDQTLTTKFIRVLNPLFVFILASVFVPQAKLMSYRLSIQSK